MRTSLVNLPWIAIVVPAASLWAQNGPVINAGGIVNAASYNSASTSVAPGSIATIFGSNLSNGTVCFTPCGPSFDKNGVLIPTLAGASVTFNGVTAPVLSVPNSSQISVQVPVEVAGSASASVVVTVNGQSSSPVNVPISPTAPGLFSLYASGSGLGAILNARDASQGVVSLPAPWFDFPNSHTAQAGDVIEIYATGLGALTTPVATGTKPTGTPQTAATPTVTIGGVKATVQFAGYAPCCVGLNQINVVMPSGIQAPNPYGVPIALSIGGQSSNTVTIAYGAYLAGFQGTAQTVTGAINGGNIQQLGLDLNPPATMTGSYPVSGSASISGGQTIYSLTGSGSGTVSSCLLAGSAGSGNWTATGTMTMTMNQEGSPNLLLGSYIASTTFTLCGTALPTRITSGGMLAGINPTTGAASFTPIHMPAPAGGLLSALTGTVDSGVTGMIITGGQVFGDLNNITGGVTLTASQVTASGSWNGSGSGRMPCGDVLRGGSGTGPWNISLSSTFKLNPDPASLVVNGGSVSGTYTNFSGPASVCGHSLNPINWQEGTLIGTVFPGGGISLWLVPSGTGVGP